MTKKTDYLFVYGTLMRGFNHPLANYLQNTQEFIGEGFFKGKLYNLGRYPGAVYEPDGKTRVAGHLYKLVRERETILHKLDEYEGAGSQFPQTDTFIRNVIPIISDNQQYSAFCYLLNNPKPGYPIIESGNYSEFLKS